jgi:hypothetical protein
MRQRRMRFGGLARVVLAGLVALPVPALAQVQLGPDAQQAPPPAAPPARPVAPRPRQAPPPPPPQNVDAEGKIAQPFATFSGLDKITGRIISFDVAIDETVQFGALQVTPRVCYARPQTVAPLTTAFVEVDEVTLDNKIRRIFTGWMFADSPGLHAVEHAVYDVWLTACKASSPDVRPPAPKQP